jgi:hypothetical protein
LGSNATSESGNGNNENIKSIYKLEYFEKKNLKIKKIVCSGDWYVFNIFLTGF